MSGRLKVEDIHVGSVHEATFYPNPVNDSGFRFRATHLDGKRAPKVDTSRTSEPLAAVNRR